MPFPHTKNIVDTDLFLPAFDQKTVGIEQEDDRKYNDHCPGIDQYQMHVPITDRRVSGQSIHDIVHHHREDRCQDIRNVSLPIVLKIRQRKLSIDRATHFSHLP